VTARFEFGPVYDLVAEVPKGEAASYGMIASLLPGVTARMVGRALSHLKGGTQTPWHRIVQSSGAIAPRPFAGEQRKRLKSEGVAFRSNGAVDWSRNAWRGPSPRWVKKNRRDAARVMEIVAEWRR